MTILQPNLKYSLLVDLSPNVQYGRVILVMDKNFCTDAAGNSFTRAENSSFFVHFDRRSVFVDMRIHVSEKLLLLGNQTRSVQATNDYDNLKVYLYFSEPVVNSSAQILDCLDVNEGTLLPINGENLGNRRFGFQVVNVSSIAIITVGFNSRSVISRSGTPISPIAPVTFLYDSQKPSVRLSTLSTSRTKDHNIPVSIKFMKPVFGFNASSLSVSGGHLLSFHEISKSKYIAEIHADGDIVSVNIPQNVTGDVAGNKNLPSNILQVRRYSVPTISSVISAITTAIFLATCLVAGLLTVSTASLQSIGAFSRPTSLLTSDPTRNLFRIACYIQVFALSRWLAGTLPVEYFEFARALQWSIPYFSLPWETGGFHPIMLGSNSTTSSHSYVSYIHGLENSMNGQPEERSSNVAVPVYGLPLTPMEYRSFFESQTMKPEAEYIYDLQYSNGWKAFERSMFWLAIVGGSFLLLHALLFLILKHRKKNSEKQRGSYGALTFPRFEIFLIILALPCISQASAAVIRGGTTSGVVVGILLLGVVGVLVLALFMFLSVGITFGKLLQYKEVLKEDETFHWYQEIIRVSLGPCKRGQWTWKNKTDSVYLTTLGPLFEDLRGPPKYMLSQISIGTPSKRRDQIIASDDETEDAEAPCIQKLFGILRIYYTLLETGKRVCLGIVAGAYLNNWSSKTPSAILLCITAFQLFFLVLKKPFIKKKVQLVENIAVAMQVGVFAACCVLLEKDLTARGETKVGIFMIVLFLLGFLAQIINEWCALFKHTIRLDPSEQSFSTGLKTASIGFLLFFAPQKMSRNLERRLPWNQQQRRETGGETGSSAERNKSSGSRNSSTPDKPWTKQLREMAKESFTTEKSSADPSTSRTTKWSGFWQTKSSSESPNNSSAEFKLKPSRLTKDLESIFASK
ncbi:uncharacterized protein LOC126674595 isoform X2 [Mercurialis annua]|nr:uncharacterized protein LOC126674595 isoform X2 [Mercurialis annua]